MRKRNRRTPQRPARRHAERRRRSDAAALARDDRRHLVHGFVSPALTDREGCTTLVKARGVFVWDANGRRYLDGLASLWNVEIGHGHPEVARRVGDQIRQLSYCPTLIGFSSEPAIRLAKRLVQLAPKGLSRVVFTSGGSEANETVIRLVRLYWRLKGYERKYNIVALARAYHGTSTGAATLTGLTPFHHLYEPLLPGVIRMPNAYCYRCPLGQSYPSCHVACADELERIVEREGAETIGAFIAEPVQGAGGVIIPPPEYFTRIREICDRHDILLVTDEVITAFGRLGFPFGINRWKVTPDLISFAKGVTSGYIPLGGVLFREEIYQTLLDAGEGFALHHGYTYSGHPVACAGALANLDVMQRDRLLTRARRLSGYLARGLAPLGKLPIVGDIRVAGLMGAIELVSDKERKTPFAPELRVAWRVRDAALQRGVIVRAAGGDNVMVCPPLIVEREHLDLLTTTLDESIREVAADLDSRT